MALIGHSNTIANNSNTHKRQPPDPEANAQKSPKAPSKRRSAPLRRCYRRNPNGASSSQGHPEGEGLGFRAPLGTLQQ